MISDTIEEHCPPGVLMSGWSIGANLRQVLWHEQDGHEPLELDS